MHRYTRDEKLKDVQLDIQYGKNPAAVLYEIRLPDNKIFLQVV